MRSIPTETYVLWITLLLLAGFALALLSGTLTLSRARRMRYFQVRRDAVLRGWQLLIMGLGLLLVAGFSFFMGVPLLSLAIPPTPTLPPTLTLPPTDIPPTLTPTLRPTRTVPPSATEGPSPTPTASDTPTVSPTPVLPEAFITPILTATVTPPAQAVAGDVRISLRDNCAVTGSQDFLDQLPKTIYAHFYYDSWLPGVQWSGVWLRDGEVVHVETSLWDGSTGGCGFSDWDNGKNWWPPGVYDVQIFIGSQWLASGHFQIGGNSPTPGPTVTLGSDSATPVVAASVTSAPPNITPTRTPQPPTATETLRPTRTATYTPSRTPTRTPTIYPPGIYGYAVIVLEGAASNARVRAAPPDGQVIGLVNEGERVTVFTQAEIIDGILWRRIGLANGLEGWIGDHLLEHLEPTP